jgi:peptidoglycan/LPS O-acetylase OafA/YrhL
MFGFREVRKVGKSRRLAPPPLDEAPAPASPHRQEAIPPAPSQIGRRIRAASDGSHVPVLDGIRGLAILLVLFHHFTLYAGVQPAAYADRVYHKLAEASWCGVDLFFVLSGFLITGILLRTKEHPNYFRNFYMRRSLRIFPLYYGTLAALFWLVPLLVTPNPAFATVLREHSWYWTYLANVLYARHGWPDFDGIGHVWSLAVEEQFYLLWPLVILLTGRRTIAAVCFGAMVSSFLVRLWLARHGHSVAAYVLMPARMDALAVGAFLAVLNARPQGLAAMSRYVLPLAALAAAGIMAIAIDYRGLNAQAFLVVTVALTCFAILFGAALVLLLNAGPTSWSRRLFTSRVLTFFGRYSYGLYVVHSLLLFGLMRPFFSAASVPRVFGSVLPGVLLFTGIGIGLSIVISLVTWHVIERPFLELKRHFG